MSRLETPGSTRATRSRFSSPAVASTRPGNDGVGSAAAPERPDASATSSHMSGQEKQRLFMQQWVEPQPSKMASYQQMGIPKAGVVENMEPLGTLPKPGVFKKLAAVDKKDGHKGRRRIVLKKSGLGAKTLGAGGSEKVDSAAPDNRSERDFTPLSAYTPPQAFTPTLQSSPSPAESVSQLSQSKLITEPSSPLLLITEIEDISASADRMPHSPTSAKKGSTTATEARRHPTRSVTRSVTRRSSISSDATELAEEGSGVDYDPNTRRIRTFDRTVEHAVNLALPQGDHVTAWALQQLADDSVEQPDKVTLIEDIYKQTADSDAVIRFSKLIREEKRRGRTDNIAFIHFNKGALISTIATPDPQPGPYGAEILLDRSLWTHDQNALGDANDAQGNPAALAHDASGDQVNNEDQSASPPRKRIKLRNPAQPNAKSSPTIMAGKPRATRVSTRRRTRAGSQSPESDTSSLSSAKSISPPHPSDEIGNNTEVADVTKVSAHHVSDANGVVSNDGLEPAGLASQGDASGPAVGNGPINGRRRANARKSAGKSANNQDFTQIPSNSPQSEIADVYSMDANTTVTNNKVDLTKKKVRTNARGMPLALQPSLFSNLAGDSKVIELASEVGKLDEDDEISRMKRAARNHTNGQTATTLSWERPLVEASAKEQQRNALSSAASRADASTLKVFGPASPASGATNGDARTTRASKRTHDQANEDARPATGIATPVLLPPSESAALSGANSRPGTPNGRPAKRQKTGVRVKNSPMKQKNGPSAGIARPSGQRDSPVEGMESQEDDGNDDYCTSCGGQGELICCDGCTRSMHFACIDPPINQDNMPDDWFCNVCQTKRFMLRVPEQKGVFASMATVMAKKNSSAFRLPPSVRNAFEDVRTGADGEFANVAVEKKSEKKDKSAIGDPERIVDAQDNPVLCHNCHEMGGPGHQMTKCAECGLYWHLDCLNPPLANSPRHGNWKCPAHVYDVLREIPARFHNYRKLKGSSTIEPIFSRGNRNNGFIDIDVNDPGLDADESGFNDAETFGRRTLLTIQGIQQDFAAKIERQRAETAVKHRITKPPRATPANIAQLSANHQAAYNLLQLSRGAQVLHTSSLVNELMNKANNDVDETGALDAADHQTLVALQEQTRLLQKRLATRIAALTTPKTTTASSSQGDAATAMTALTPVSESGTCEVFGK